MRIERVVFWLVPLLLIVRSSATGSRRSYIPSSCRLSMRACFCAWVIIPWRFVGLRTGDRIGVPDFVGRKDGAASTAATGFALDLEEETLFPLTGGITVLFVN